MGNEPLAMPFVHFANAFDLQDVSTDTENHDARIGSAAVTGPERQS
jgi:hypothetical protein